MIEPIILNSDIKKIEMKARSSAISSDEAELLRFGQCCPETKIQQYFVNCVKALAQDFRFIWGFKAHDIMIAQRDNGAATKSQRLKKAREGNFSGMPDFEIFLFNADEKKTATIFVEVKRIDTLSKIKGDPEHYLRQLACHERLRRMGHPVFLTNNPIFFKKVICQEIKKFFKYEY